MNSRKVIIDHDEGDLMPPIQGENWLYIIGINTYSNGIPKLSNARNDAEQIEEILTKYYGFQTKKALYDAFATRRGILNELREIAKSIKPEDNLVIYYAGHGFWDKVTKLGFLIPVDGEVNIIDTFVSNADILSTVRNIHNLHTFLILDSCFSGSIFQRDSLDEKITISDAYRLQNHPSKWCLTSGMLEKVADGYYNDNSPFAKALKIYLEKPINGSPFTAQDLISYIEKTVPNNSSQQPYGNRIIDSEDFQGPFLFKHKEYENSKDSQKLIILHGNHQNDIYFSNWICGKLQILGYACELYENIFFTHNQDAIIKVLSKECIHLLWVISERSIDVNLILSHAIMIEERGIKPNLILPIILDENALEHELINNRYSIPFMGTWREGLNNLILFFDKYQVPKKSSGLSLNYTADKKRVIPKIENYYTNWVSFEIFENLYIYLKTPNLESQLREQKVLFLDDNGCLITTCCLHRLGEQNTLLEAIKISDFIAFSSYKVNYILNGLEISALIRETNRKVIRLLNDFLYNFFRKKNLKEYHLANNKSIFYFHSNMPAYPRKLKDNNLSPTIKLHGKAKEYKWCFAFSANAGLYPIHKYIFNLHLHFLNEDESEIADKGKIHALRRGIGSSWFNKKWLDHWLCSLLSLNGGNEDKYMEIPVCCCQSLKINETPIMLESEWGYNEPQKLIEDDTETDLY